MKEHNIKRRYTTKHSSQFDKIVGQARVRQEIKFFMESKHQNVDFLCDENWLNDLAFLTDITQYLLDLNLRLQGKNQLVNKLFEHICAFEKKLELFQVQLNRATLTHFTWLVTRKLEFPNLDCTKYGASV